MKKTCEISIQMDTSSGMTGYTFAANRVLFSCRCLVLPLETRRLSSGDSEILKGCDDKTRCFYDRLTDTLGLGDEVFLSQDSFRVTADEDLWPVTKEYILKTIAEIYGFGRKQIKLVEPQNLLELK